MKRLKYLFIVPCLVYVTIVILANIFFDRGIAQKTDIRNIFINRISTQVQRQYFNEEYPDVNEIIRNIYLDNQQQYKNEYSKEELPENILFLDCNTSDAELVSFSGNQRLATIKNKNGENAGFLLFVYADSNSKALKVYMNAVLAAGFLLLISFLIFIQKAVIYPFLKFSEYPERLSKGYMAEKLPESKNRYFGKFIWGINMLSDKIQSDRKHIDKLLYERQTMLTTLVHGIKTPVSNVKLYASAIETGLYREDGVPDEKDAVIARKIEKNADEIIDLVKMILENTTSGMVAFEPSPESFYVTELLDCIRAEYENRLKTLHIPFTISTETNAIINSDKKGLLRILSQLMENAIKYGNGEGITVSAEKNDEGFFFSVRNKGELLPEKELPFVFGNFWRGSNSVNKEGSGIGLFEAKAIAMKLGGDILIKRLEDSGEMELVVFIEAIPQKPEAESKSEAHFFFESE
ncbi:MAG TPA: HAMP domain-containing sensor histidine kinase [Acetivibrio sp.]|jgi:signal transduction histidine kinase|nr:HAMP domain-containing histidine kinase [Clostridium sp.]HQA56489.1 HAMP domain-containing sensor histidine kinase [Acetivibrio sp.]